MKASVENRLAEIRQRRGVSAAELAERVGIRRQTVYAIEAGTYLPNTELALKLARELDVSVHRLFALKSKPQRGTTAVAARVLWTDRVAKPSCGCAGRRPLGRRAGQRIVSLPEATAIATTRANDKDMGHSDGRDAEATLLESERASRRSVIAGQRSRGDAAGPAGRRACGVRPIPGRRRALCRTAARRHGDLPGRISRQRHW